MRHRLSSHCFAHIVSFDLQSANINDDNADKLNPADLPDVVRLQWAVAVGQRLTFAHSLQVLIKKSYVDRRHGKRARKFMLKTLQKDEGELRKDEEDDMVKDYEAFLNDVEEDKEYRSNFKLYKSEDWGVGCGVEVC